MTIQGLILDLDGTLVDSAPDIRAVLNEVLRDNRRPELDLPTITGMIGDGLKRLLECALAATGGMPDSVEFDRLFEDFAARYGAPDRKPAVSAYPHALECLEALRSNGLRLAVCTNKLTAAAHRILQAAGLDSAVDHVVGGDSTGMLKPDAAPVLAALGAIGVSPGRALMVGDGINDIRAGHAAGLRVIWADWGYGLPEPCPETAEHACSSWQQLPSILARIGREEDQPGRTRVT